MALDAHGTWHPKCDLSSCKADQAPDGLVEVLVLVGDAIQEAILHVCAEHRDRLSQPAQSVAA